MSEIGMVNLAGLMLMPGGQPEAAQTPATAAFGPLLASRMPTAPGRAGDGAMPLPPVPPGGKSWPQDGKVLPPASLPLPWRAQGGSLQAGSPDPAADAALDSDGAGLADGLFPMALALPMAGQVPTPANAGSGADGAEEIAGAVLGAGPARAAFRAPGPDLRPGHAISSLPGAAAADSLPGVTEAQGDLAFRSFQARPAESVQAVAPQFRGWLASADGRAPSTQGLNESPAGLSLAEPSALAVSAEAAPDSAITESVLRWSALMSGPADNAIQLPGRLPTGRGQDRLGLQSAEGASGSALHGLSAAMSAQAGASPEALDAPLVTTLPRQPLASSQWAQAIGERVLWLNDSAKSSARIILNPPELGLLELHVEVVDEKASVWFGSQNPSVREALEQTLPRLRDMLEAQGMQLGDVDISSQGRQSDRAHKPETRVASTDAERELAMAPPAPVAAVARGLVDVYA